MWITLFCVSLVWFFSFSLLNLRFHLLLCRTTSLQIRLHPETCCRSWESKLLARMLKEPKSTNPQEGSYLKTLIKLSNKRSNTVQFWAKIYLSVVTLFVEIKKLQFRTTVTGVCGFYMCTALKCSQHLQTSFCKSRMRIAVEENGLQIWWQSLNKVFLTNSFTFGFWLLYYKTHSTHNFHHYRRRAADIVCRRFIGRF